MAAYPCGSAGAGIVVSGRRRLSARVQAPNARTQRPRRWGLAGAAYGRHSACWRGRQAPFSWEEATHWVMKFMPSTPSQTFG